MVQAWFHKRLKSGVYRVGGHTFSVASDGMLIPTPSADSEVVQRLYQNPSVEQLEYVAPLAPPPPQAPTTDDSTPTVDASLDGAQAEKRWYHKTLRNGRYAVAGVRFFVTDLGRLIPDPDLDLVDRCTANGNLQHLPKQAGDEAQAAKLAQLFAKEQVHVQRPQTQAGSGDPNDCTMEYDVGDLDTATEVMRRAAAKSAELLRQYHEMPVASREVSEHMVKAKSLNNKVVSLVETLIAEVETAGDDQSKVKESIDNFKVLAEALRGENEAILHLLNDDEKEQLDADVKARLAPIKDRFTAVMEASTADQPFAPANGPTQLELIAPSADEPKKAKRGASLAARK